ncbi:cytochrome c(L), periplasmic [Mongoliimonas terrestris]|uniref:cytochrome c(L), periplasmic n=1 Tax=Mongoliimonas terrestris TaxID=1709001 RepID=UPI00094979D9|nr:cytochrome c(L), periplasmic [Mongoliimonas terrestris]
MKSWFVKAGLASVVTSTLAVTAAAQIPLFNVVTGETLDLTYALEEGRDTDAVKTFLSTGVNIYNENPEFLPKGEEIYLMACSGCHGHHAEGKIGPGLNDSYWTYTGNDTDEGLFRTVFGGAQGQMGPQYGHLTLDEMLLSMAWVRHIYTGDPSTATWLTPEQRTTFKPYPKTHPDPNG